MARRLISQRLSFPSLFATGIIFLFLATLGCGPQLSVEKTIDVEPDEVRTVIRDAIGQAQTIKVAASSTISCNIHIYLEGDENEVDLAIATKKDSDKILAGELEVTSVSLSAEIPANKEAVVRFQPAAEKGSISYSISN